MKGNSMTKVKDMAKESCIIQLMMYFMKAIGKTIKWMEMVNTQMEKNQNPTKVNLRIINSMATEFTQTGTTDLLTAVSLQMAKETEWGI